MTSITEILPGVYVAEIPKTAWNFSMKRNALEFSIGTDWSYVPLPPGNWQLLFTTHSMTEEQAGSVVKEGFEDSWDSSYDPQYNETTYFTTYWNYETGDYECDTRIESFHSALIAKNLPVDKNYAVLTNKNKLYTK